MAFHTNLLLNLDKIKALDHAPASLEQNYIKY
jgi:hypothetical protein